MKKLFSVEDFEQVETNIEEIIPNTPQERLEKDITVNIEEVIDEYNNDLVIASEGFKRASNELHNVLDIKAALESKKLASVEYFTSIENFNLYLKSITNNLGIKVKIPSMEDFKNPYGTKACHQITMEGFKDIVKSIWEKIKSFFKAFFKKVMLFLKRLANADLELDQYEKYIDDLMNNVRSSKKTVKPIEIKSKLPVLLGDPDSRSIDANFIFNRGEQKLKNLTYTNKVLINEALPKFVDEIKNISNNKLKNLLNNVKTKTYEQVREERSRIMNEYINNFIKFIFKNKLTLSSAPDKVFDDIMNALDTYIRDEKDLEVFSLYNDRDSYFTLPQNYNLYLGVADYNVSDTLTTTKTYITSNTEISSNIKNTIVTISNSSNLLKFYDFYKKFSKEADVRKINDKLERCDKIIEEILSDLGKRFNEALNNTNLSGTDLSRESYAIISTETNSAFVNAPKLSMDETDAHLISIGMAPLNDTSKPNEQPPNLQQPSGQQEPPIETSSSNNIPSDELKRKSDEIRELNIFMSNYISSIQSLIRELSAGLIGLQQVCRLELIKYLYQSARLY